MLLPIQWLCPEPFFRSTFILPHLPRVPSGMECPAVLFLWVLCSCPHCAVFSPCAPAASRPYPLTLFIPQARQEGGIVPPTTGGAAMDLDLPHSLLSCPAPARGGTSGIWGRTKPFWKCDSPWQESNNDEFCLCKINSPSNMEHSCFCKNACGFSKSLLVGTTLEQKSQGIQDSLIIIFSSAGFLLKHLAERFL